MAGMNMNDVLPDSNAANTSRSSLTKTERDVDLSLRSPNMGKNRMEMNGGVVPKISAVSFDKVRKENDRVDRIKKAREVWLAQDAKIRDSTRSFSAMPKSPPMSPEAAKPTTRKVAISLARPEAFSPDTSTSTQQVRNSSARSSKIQDLSSTWHGGKRNEGQPPKSHSAPQEGFLPRYSTKSPVKSKSAPKKMVSPRTPNSMVDETPIVAQIKPDNFWIDEASISHLPTKTNAPNKFAAMPQSPGELHASISSMATALPPMPRRRRNDDESVFSKISKSPEINGGPLDFSLKPIPSASSGEQNSFGEEEEDEEDYDDELDHPDRQAGLVDEYQPLKGATEDDYENLDPLAPEGNGQLLVDGFPKKRRWSSKNLSDYPVWPPIIKVFEYEKGDMSGVSIGSGFSEDDDSWCDSLDFLGSLGDEDFSRAEDLVNHQAPARRTSYRIRYDGPTSLRLNDVYNLPPVPSNDNRFESSAVPPDDMPNMPARRVTDSTPSAPNRDKLSDYGDDESVNLDDVDDRQSRPDVWVTADSEEEEEAMFKVRRVWAVEAEDAKEKDYSVHKRDLMNQIRSLVGAPEEKPGDEKPKLPERSWHVQTFVEKKGQLTNAKPARSLNLDEFVEDIEAIAEEAVKEKEINKKAREQRMERIAEIRRNGLKRENVSLKVLQAELHAHPVRPKAPSPVPPPKTDTVVTIVEPPPVEETKAEAPTMVEIPTEKAPEAVQSPKEEETKVEILTEEVVEEVQPPEEEEAKVEAPTEVADVVQSTKEEEAKVELPTEEVAEVAQSPKEDEAKLDVVEMEETHEVENQDEEKASMKVEAVVESVPSAAESSTDDEAMVAMEEVEVNVEETVPPEPPVTPVPDATTEKKEKKKKLHKVKDTELKEPFSPSPDSPVTPVQEPDLENGKKEKKSKKKTADRKVEDALSPKSPKKEKKTKRTKSRSAEDPFSPKSPDAPGTPVRDHDSDSVKKEKKSKKSPRGGKRDSVNNELRFSSHGNMRDVEPPLTPRRTSEKPQRKKKRPKDSASPKPRREKKATESTVEDDLPTISPESTQAKAKVEAKAERSPLVRQDSDSSIETSPLRDRQVKKKTNKVSLTAMVHDSSSGSDMNMLSDDDEESDSEFYNTKKPSSARRGGWWKA